MQWAFGRRLVASGSKSLTTLPMKWTSGTVNTEAETKLSKLGILLPYSFSHGLLADHRHTYHCKPLPMIQWFNGSMVLVIQLKKSYWFVFGLIIYFIGCEFLVGVIELTALSQPSLYKIQRVYCIISRWVFTWYSNLTSTFLSIGIHWTDAYSYQTSIIEILTRYNKQAYGDVDCFLY